MRTPTRIHLLLALLVMLQACGESLSTTGRDADAFSATDVASASDEETAGFSEGSLDESAEDAAPSAGSEFSMSAPGGETESSALDHARATNRAPVLAAFPALRFGNGDTLIHHFSASDPDTDELEYFLHPLPPQSRFDRRSGRLIVRRPLEAGERFTGIVGVRDASGSEIARPLVIDWDPPPTASSAPLDDVRTGPESGDLPWPVGQLWLHALQVSGDGLEWPLRWVLTGRTPAGLELDRDTGVLRWTAPERYLGDPVEVGLRVTDARGRVLERSLRIIVDNWERSALPAQHVARGESVLLDWRDGSALPCALLESAPFAPASQDCAQMVETPDDAQRGFRRTWARLALADRQVERELGLWTYDAACEEDVAPEELPERLLVDEVMAGQTLEGRWCPTAQPMAHDITLPALDTPGWLEVELRNLSNAWTDLDLLLVCPETDLNLRRVARSSQLSIVTRVPAGVACSITLQSRRPLLRTTSLSLGVRVSESPSCAISEEELRTLAVAELVAERVCPGETRSWLLPAGSEPFDLVSRNSQIDASLVAIGEDLGERLLLYVVGRGEDETIRPLHDELLEGEELHLRIRGHDVPMEGGEFLLRPLSRNRAAR